MTLRVAHVITNLDAGGAEMSLYKLLDHMRSRDVQSAVYSLRDQGIYGPRIAALGVEVRALGMRPAAPNPLKVLQLASWLRIARPDVVQTWMYHADLIGGIAARLAGGIPVIWGIRHSQLERASTKARTIVVARACALLSRSIPARIVCCSHSSMSTHAALGYAARKMKLILNGVDQQRFAQNGDARTDLRSALGLAADTPLAGLVARYHNVKNFAGFARSAEIVARHQPEVRFLLCGSGVENNVELRQLLCQHGLTDRCNLFGEQSDVSRILAALDVLISSSLSEGFPNIVAEAMSCGVPCVVTDVGDSALIVGETGLVVPPADDLALAQACLQLIREAPEQRKLRGERARDRIASKFSIGCMLDEYETVFRGVAANAIVLH
jgi:glycosyltransferase involved in cell wall biosynthesis